MFWWIVQMMPTLVNYGVVSKTGAVLFVLWVLWYILTKVRNTVTEVWKYRTEILHVAFLAACVLGTVIAYGFCLDNEATCRGAFRSANETLSHTADFITTDLPAYIDRASDFVTNLTDAALAGVEKHIDESATAASSVENTTPKIN